MSTMIVAPTEPITIETAPDTSASKISKSIVEMVARHFVVPVALFLDVITMLIRVAETTIQLTIPDVYATWQAHTSHVLGFLFYSSALIVVSGISLGVTAALFLAMPLLYLINRRLDAVQKIRNRRVKKETSEHLEEKKKRYQSYVCLAVSVPVLFGVSYFLSQQHWDWIKWVTAVADIAAPIIVLFVITQTEREHNDIDPQEEAVSIATGVVLDNVRKIRSAASGLLRKEQAAILKAGTEGDIEGMIDAATPRDEQDRLYTIVDICKRLGVPYDRDSRDRKKVYRIVANAAREGESEIRRDRKGRGYLVPGKLFDKLFGDWLIELQGQGQPVDTRRTNSVSYAASGTGPVGHSVDMSTRQDMIQG